MDNFVNNRQIYGKNTLLLVLIKITDTSNDRLHGFTKLCYEFFLNFFGKYIITKHHWSVISHSNVQRYIDVYTAIHVGETYVKNRSQIGHMLPSSIFSITFFAMKIISIQVNLN